MDSILSRIYSAARRRLDLLITSLPGGHNGSWASRRRRRDDRRSRSSATSTPVSTPMSMYSVIGAGDNHATEGATPEGGAAMPVFLSSLLPPPQMVVVALDATRDHREEEVSMALKALVASGNILRGGDSLVVLHAISSPSEDHAPLLGRSF